MIMMIYDINRVKCAMNVVFICLFIFNLTKVEYMTVHLVNSGKLSYLSGYCYAYLFLTCSEIVFSTIHYCY